MDINENNDMKVQDENNTETSEVTQGEQVQHKLRVTSETLYNKLTPVVLRQTDYTEDQARKKLEEHNFDLKALLYEWMGVDIIKEDDACKTGSQERYRLIRQTMDEANKKFR